jgi:hypothetical protein
MSDIHFGNQQLMPRDQGSRGAFRFGGLLLLFLVLGALGFLAYKMVPRDIYNGPSPDNSALEQIEQHLALIDKRMDELEKRRGVSTTEPAATSQKSETTTSVGVIPPSKPVYRVFSASSLPAEAGSSPNAAPTSPTQAVRPEGGGPSDADHEAWEATTNRLGDVVGVVDTQETEISQDRAALNELLAQTRRTALQFELRRGADQLVVGPVSLLLKSSDPKSERYTVCVYIDDKCVELKERTLNEVVVFVPSRGAAPLELVATSVGRDAIAGYLEVPTEKAGR